MIKMYEKIRHVHWGQKLALARAKKAMGLTSDDLRAPVWLTINLNFIDKRNRMGKSYLTSLWVKVCEKNAPTLSKVTNYA